MKCERCDSEKPNVNFCVGLAYSYHGDSESASETYDLCNECLEELKNSVETFCRRKINSEPVRETMPALDSQIQLTTLDKALSQIDNRDAALLGEFCDLLDKTYCIPASRDKLIQDFLSERRGK